MNRRELERRERRMIMIESFVSGMAFVVTIVVIIFWMMIL